VFTVVGQTALTRMRERAASSGLDLRDGLLEIVARGQRIADRLHGVRADVQRDDVGTLLRQPDGVRPSLTATGSRDEGDFPIEGSHSSLL
jgi:hypothetical protein